MFKLSPEILKFESDSERLDFEVEHFKEEAVDYFKILIEAAEKIDFSEVIISFFYPFVDIQSVWHP